MKNQKKFIVALATIVAVSSSSAVFADDDEDVCKSTYEFAEIAMKLRQVDAPMYKSMEIAKGSAQAEAIMSDAYDYPLMRAEENKAATVQSFANKIYSICHKHLVLNKNL